MRYNNEIMKCHPYNSQLWHNNDRKILFRKDMIHIITATYLSFSFMTAFVCSHSCSYCILVIAYRLSAKKGFLYRCLKDCLIPSNCYHLFSEAWIHPSWHFPQIVLETFCLKDHKGNIFVHRKMCLEIIESLSQCYAIKLFLRLPIWIFFWLNDSKDSFPIIFYLF